MMISFTPERKTWLENNKGKLGCSSLSKAVGLIVDEFIKRKEEESRQDLQEEQRQKTPEEELDIIVEKMGILEDRWHEKFEATRRIIPRDVPGPKKDSDMTPYVRVIWSEIVKRNGFIQTGKGKGVSITKEDLANYEQLGRLNLRKRQLEKEITEAKAVGEKS